MADSSNNSSPEVPEKKSTLKTFRKAVRRTLAFGGRSNSSNDMTNDSSHSLNDSANGKVSSISVPVSLASSPQLSPSSVASAPLPTVVEETPETTSSAETRPEQPPKQSGANTAPVLTDIEAEKRIKMLEFGIEDNNKEIQDLREKLKGYETLRNEVENIRKSMETHKNSEISQLRREIVETTNQVIQCRTDIAKYKSEHDTLQESIRRLKEEQAVVKLMYSEIQSDLDRENQSMEDCKVENDSPLCAFTLHIF